MSYMGWLRVPGEKWQATVTAGDQEIAWRLLRQHVEAHPAKFLDTYVAAAGVDPPGSRRAAKPRTAAPDPFLHVFEAAGVPVPVPEYRFAKPRRWRFDFAWPDRLLAFEVEGGTWSGGRHTRGAGYEKDCEKYNAAAIAGWKVLRATTGMVRDGRAMAVVQQAFSTAEPVPPGTFTPSINPDTTAPSSPALPEDFPGNVPHGF